MEAGIRLQSALTRPIPFLLLALLTLPPVAVAETDETIPALAVIDVRRSGDDLVVLLRADRSVTAAKVRLESNGVTVGLPDWERAAWTRGERLDWTYKLLKDVDTATLVFGFTESYGVEREQRHTFYVPDPPPATSTTGAPKVLVTQATAAGKAVAVDLQNVGDVEARGVVVSLEDAQQRKVGSPYSRTVAPIAPGASGRASFELLADSSQVVVALEYANRTERTTVTLLGRAVEETGEANVTLATDLPFREVDLGRSADYAVTVRNAGRPSLVQLQVEGLPQGYSARFFVGGSPVPSLYVDRNQTRGVTLTVTVPNSPQEVDRTVDFVLDALVNGTRAGRLEMGVAVRGVGRLEVSSAGEEQPLPAGGEASFRVQVKNAGSAPLFNVELDSRRPYGWTVRTEPRVLDRLDPNETATFTVRARAPDVLAGGRYTLDVAAKSGETASRFETLPMRVEEAESGGGWLWLVFLLIIAGILGFGAWWKWRG